MLFNYKGWHFNGSSIKRATDFGGPVSWTEVHYQHPDGREAFGSGADEAAAREAYAKIDNWEKYGKPLPEIDIDPAMPF